MTANRKASRRRQQALAATCAVVVVTAVLLAVGWLTGGSLLPSDQAEQAIRPGLPAAPTPTTTLPEAYAATAAVELIGDSQAMLTVDVTDPGSFAPGQQVTHQLIFGNATGETIYLDAGSFDRISSDGMGRLVTAGDGCAPYYDSQADQLAVGCRLDYRPLEIPAGGRAAEPITIYTDPQQAGPVPLLPGTYTLEQAIRWHRQLDPNSPLLGTATVRITYRVMTVVEALGHD